MKVASTVRRGAVGKGLAEIPLGGIPVKQVEAENRTSLAAYSTPFSSCRPGQEQEQSAVTCFKQPVRSVIEGAECNYIRTHFASTWDYGFDSIGAKHL
jgi:hypothetical protein